jgi:hypothetical protein
MDSDIPAILNRNSQSNMKLKVRLGTFVRPSPFSVNRKASRMNQIQKQKKELEKKKEDIIKLVKSIKEKNINKKNINNKLVGIIKNNNPNKPDVIANINANMLKYIEEHLTDLKLTTLDRLLTTLHNLNSNSININIVSATTNNSNTSNNLSFQYNDKYKIPKM